MFPLRKRETERIMKEDFDCAHCGKRMHTTKARYKAHPYCRRGYCVEGRKEYEDAQWRAERPWLDRAEWRNISADPKHVRWAPFVGGVQIGVDDGLPVGRDRSDDPRLAGLPEDLRAKAAEFLGLHEAWDTEFEASNHEPGHLRLRWVTCWGGDKGRWLLKSAAHFHFCQTGVYNSHCPEQWETETREKTAENGAWYEAEGSGPLPLRRSADFAEFVQRFARGES